MAKVKVNITDRGVIQKSVRDSDSNTMEIEVPLVLSGSSVPLPSQIRGQFIYIIPGALTVGTNAAPQLRPSGPFTITQVRLDIKTPPTGSAVIVDVNVNGNSIFQLANRPQIAALSSSGSSSTLSTTSLIADDNITIDIDQIGSTTAGSDLTVSVRGYLT